MEAVGFCEAYSWVATGGSDGMLRIWELDTMACRHAIKHDEGIVKLVWHPSTPVVFTCTAGGTTSAYDARSGECLHAFTGPRGSIFDMALGRDDAGDFILSACDDGGVYVFRM